MSMTKVLEAIETEYGNHFFSLWRCFCWQVAQFLF